MCDFGRNSAPIAIEIGICDVDVARVSDAMRDFGRNSAPIAIAVGIFDVATARVSDAMSDFGRNSGPISVEVGILRRRDRPGFGFPTSCAISMGGLGGIWGL